MKRLIIAIMAIMAVTATYSLAATLLDDPVYDDQVDPGYYRDLAKAHGPSQGDANSGQGGALEIERPGKPIRRYIWDHSTRSYGNQAGTPPGRIEVWQHGSPPVDHYHYNLYDGNGNLVETGYFY